MLPLIINTFGHNNFFLFEFHFSIYSENSSISSLMFFPPDLHFGTISPKCHIFNRIHDNMKTKGIKYTSSQCIHCVNFFFSAKFF